ncbi:MAG TPA: helix-turn-helix domain-containing protein [Opitutaceae bacterium]|jgi:transcriptional regulator with XRE-family HTH domain
MSEILKSPSELQAELGERIRLLRIGRMLTQAEASSKAGISQRALAMLERGEGSTVETLLRSLSALDAAGGIDLLAPRPGVSPMGLLRGQRKEPRRFRHPAPAR